MEERRELERFKLRLPARVEVVSQDPNVSKDILSLETDNICSGGAFFHTLSPLPKGIQVKIDMVLNSIKPTNSKEAGPTVKVGGNVLRSEPIGMAIQFDTSYKIIPPSNA